MIPLLLIPQMILSGLLFPFDKLNNLISTKGKVPIVADLMASRWAYEAMAVYQFRNNSYERPYFDAERLEALTDFNSSYLVDKLQEKRRFIADHIAQKNDSIVQVMEKDLAIIQATLKKDYFQKGFEKQLATPWTLATFTPAFNTELDQFLQTYKEKYLELYNTAVTRKDNAQFAFQKTSGQSLNELKNKYYNDNLADLVKNVSEKDRILEFDGKLIQQINPIFQDPDMSSPLNYRAPFFAPEKNLVGMRVSTFWFDILVIWVMTALLYATLYFELLRKLINAFDKVPGKMTLPKANQAKKK
jgi:hypothetical protein